MKRWPAHLRNKHARKRHCARFRHFCKTVPQTKKKMKNDTIDISKLDKAEVLAALYNASKQQGLGFMHARGREAMTVEQARWELKEAEAFGSYFDYLHGRVMKIDLKGDALHTGLYDRDNGPGAAAASLRHLLEVVITPA